MARKKTKARRPRQQKLKQILVGYITTPSQEVALALARVLIEETLAACANIFGPVTSVYEWKGAVQTESEWVIILKTTRSAWPKLCGRIAQEHPYEVPCIVAWNLSEGHPPFLNWVQETSLGRNS